MIYLCKEKGIVKYWTHEEHLALRWKARGYDFLNREIVLIPMLTTTEANKRQ